MGTHAFIAANTFVGYMQALGWGWRDKPTLPLFISVDFNACGTLRATLHQRKAMSPLGTKQKSHDVRWFTEGFDAGDPIEVQALLKALAA
jgi:hypothetical protein